MEDEQESTRLFEVRVVGQASEALSEDLGAVRATLTTTGMVFEISDQAALHGLLRRIESLGLELVSIQPIRAPSDSP